MLSQRHICLIISCTLLSPGGGGGGGRGYSDIFIHTWALVIFGGSKFQYFWGFQKNKYFLGCDDFMDIFWGHHKIGLYLGVISMHLRVFS